MTEEWRGIEGYENLYQVSNLGRVRSVDRYVKTKSNSKCFRKGKILKQSEDNDGYKRLNLSKNGKPKLYLVHRLVAMTFLQNPHNYPFVNHKDENPSNNEVSNLEWCTNEYNINYGTARERMSNSKKGIYINRPDLSKKVLQYTLNGDLVNEYPSTQEAQRQTGIKYQNILRCCNGKRKSAGGFKWRYK